MYKKILFLTACFAFSDVCSVENLLNEEKIALCKRRMTEPSYQKALDEYTQKVLDISNRIQKNIEFSTPDKKIRIKDSCKLMAELSELMQTYEWLRLPLTNFRKHSTENISKTESEPTSTLIPTTEN